MHEALQEKLATAPTNPGIYIFKDNNNKIIYIGKAKALRPRVRSYFQKSRDQGAKLTRLVKQIADVEFIITDSEIEALILEANLVKEYAPRYNVNLKDDKSFPYIRLTYESFPRIFPTRKLIRDGSKYFGPYTDVKHMRELLKTVKRIFPIRSCNLELTQKAIAAGSFKVCLNYHIKRCLGPCEGKINQAEYQRIVGDVVNFINGKDRQVVNELSERMRQSSEAMAFEKAARIRDQIEFIKAFQYKQKVIVPDELDRDIIAVATEDDDACGAVFKVRDGKIIGKQHFYLNGVAEEPMGDIVTFFVKRYYLKADFVPSEIHLMCDIDEKTQIEKWLEQSHNKKIKIVVPQIGEKAKLMEMCRLNAKLQLGELLLQKMKTEDYVPHCVKALQRDLKLEKLPRRIEAFDISNIQGTNPVASMVTFIDGKAAKSEYRRFKIRGKSTPDDFAMMAEVVKRRYSRLIRESKDFPDLILVDGGKGQLSSALKSLNELGIANQPIIALAKRLDEVFTPACSDAQNIPKASSGLRLLQRIRDESHRFAIEYHRKLRSKCTLKSELDDIPGIGKNRRNELLKRFGSISKIKKASIEALSAVDGISERLAISIYNHLHNNEKKESDQ
ncbi:excinuclease ABC subunit C [candidate division KSB1 bacterium]|nr:excinuclease ABC subunit C [candidate division KSB1 bacterium]